MNITILNSTRLLLIALVVVGAAIVTIPAVAHADAAITASDLAGRWETHFKGVVTLDKASIKKTLFNIITHKLDLTNQAGKVAIGVFHPSTSKISIKAGNWPGVDATNPVYGSVSRQVDGRLRIEWIHLHGANKPTPSGFWVKAGK